MNKRDARVLVVDDDDSHVELIRRAFKSHPSQVILNTAATLREARDYLAQASPDLLLVDLRLPDGYGSELLRENVEKRSFPVVVMTGHGDEQAVVDAMKAGALDYVVKSSETLAEMPHTADRALRQWEDISERRRAEERLRLLSSAVEQTSDGVAVVDLEGNLLFLNDAFASMHGYSPGELLGKHLSVFHSPEQILSVTAANRQIRETGEFGGEIWHLRRDGSVFPTLMRNSLLRDAAGNPIGMIGTMRDITDQKRAEEELTRHREHLEEAVKERTRELDATNQKLRREIAEREQAQQAVQKEQRLLRQLLDLQERDRKLVAYEIHDGLAQKLTGAVLQLQAFSQLQDRDPDEAQSTLDTAVHLLGECTEEARRLIGGLRPMILDESGIVAAIEYLVCEHQQHGGPEIEFSHEFPYERLAVPLETAIFRIVQESLTNVCRHSRSERVRIELVGVDGRIRLEVRDWGIGFDPAIVAENRFGLRGIRERVRLLGGKATIDSSPGDGTRVVIDLPLLERTPDEAGQ